MRAGDGRRELDFLSAHARFHRTLLQGCPNPRLRDIADSLRDVAEVYRCWSTAPGVSAARDVAGEHRRIAEAAVARDAEAAVTALREHVQRTTDLLLTSQRQPAGAFAAVVA